VTTVVREDGVARCGWAANDEEYRRYHDEEWGVALHGDRALFEKLSLEGFQAGCRGSRSCASDRLSESSSTISTLRL